MNIRRIVLHELPQARRYIIGKPPTKISFVVVVVVAAAAAAAAAAAVVVVSGGALLFTSQQQKSMSEGQHRLSCAITLRWKFADQTGYLILCMLIPGQPVLVLTRRSQASGRATIRTPIIFKSLP